jgi:hypothetical protein
VKRSGFAGRPPFFETLTSLQAVLPVRWSKDRRTMEASAIKSAIVTQVEALYAPDFSSKIRMDFLSNQAVMSGIRDAWHDSNPGPIGGHEEGGFIVQTNQGGMMVTRWPSGSGDSIVVPDHPGGRIKEGVILASFHTHPNTGPDYLQEPSVTDIRAVLSDPDLKGADYHGELVISVNKVYLIKPTGAVEEIGRTADLLN